MNPNNPRDCYFRDMLVRRAQSLIKLCELNAPDPIIENQIGLIVHAACGLTGEGVLTKLFMLTSIYIRREAEFCTEKDCGRPLVTQQEKNVGQCCQHVSFGQEN